MSLFESYERRIDQIVPIFEKYGIKDFEEAKAICNEKGFDPYEIVKSVQPICFENACWAYTLGAAIAIFFIPTIVGFVISLAHGFSEVEADYKICSACISKPNSSECDTSASKVY